MRQLVASPDSPRPKDCGGASCDDRQLNRMHASRAFTPVPHVKRRRRLTRFQAGHASNTDQVSCLEGSAFSAKYGVSRGSAMVAGTWPVELAGSPRLDQSRASVSIRDL